MQKYKVFLNERIIAFSLFDNVTLDEETSMINENSSTKDILSWVSKLEKDKRTEIVFKRHNPELLFRNFRAAFLNINAAGGIVNRSQKMLFIFRNGKWDLPKGKVEKGEGTEEAALREVEEECGIVGHRIIKQLPSTFHIYRSPYKKNKGKWIFKETFWYEMDYQGDLDGVPQKEEGITSVRWIARDQLGEVLKNTYSNLAELILLYQ